MLKTDTNERKIKLGLALGGGGARGSYQIGVIKFLEEIGILKKIKYVSGTSIGSINTLMITAGFSYKKMEEVWAKIANKDVYGGEKRFKRDKKGVFDLNDIFETLQKEIDKKKIWKSKINGYATAAKMTKGSLINQLRPSKLEKTVFHLNKTNDPNKACLASSSIPIIFGPTYIDDEAYIDGGILDNLPLGPLIANGCNCIIAVPIDSMFGKIEKYFSYPLIIIDLESHYAFKKIPIDVLNFNPNLVKDKEQYGYEMAKYMYQKLVEQGFIKKQLPRKIKQKLPIYINISKEEEKNINIFNKQEEGAAT